jgi:hypothetical protein
MDTASSSFSSGALQRALSQARIDPRVGQIALSLHVDLADESVWQRVLGQAERNYQLGLAAAARLDPVSTPGEEGDWQTDRHAAAAIAAYQAINRL